MTTESLPQPLTDRSGSGITEVTRRSALIVGAAGAGALALAACGGGGGSGSPGATPTAASDTTLVALDQIKVGEAVSAKLPGGAPIIVARPTATTAACFSAICTHQGCTVKPAGTQLHCPCHGSVYNAVTGAVIKGPAPRALPPVAVHISNGNVLSGDDASGA
jgi:nitrite reductase/ring-hydroxylating ferredoxin subunit